MTKVGKHSLPETSSGPSKKFSSANYYTASTDPERIELKIIKKFVIISYLNSLFPPYWNVGPIWLCHLPAP